MTLFNILGADKSPELVRIRLAALCIVLLMAGCAFAEKAHAAMACGPKAPHPAASVQCRVHPLGAAGHGTQAAADNDANGARLTPLSPTATAVRSAPLAATPAAALQVPHGQAAAGFGALPLERGRVNTRTWEARAALGEVMQDASAPTVSAGAFSPPVAWSILLTGLLGLFVMTRGPRAVAHVRSWAAAPSSPPARSGTRASALDRLDVARYAQTETHRARQGHFVRSAAAGRFS
jgi:hypothetical protein